MKGSNRVWILSFGLFVLSVGVWSSLGQGGEPPKALPRARGFLVASDYPSLQAAIDALPPEGGTVFIPAGTYEITKTIDLTRRYGLGAVPGRAAVTIQGAGICSTRLVGKTGDMPIFDLSMSGYCVFRDLYVQGVDCEVGFLMARGPGKGSAGSHVMENVVMSGRYRKAAVYLMGSEVNRFYNCHFSNTLPDAFTIYFGAGNMLGVKSPYVEAQGGSNTELRLYGCTICSFGENSVGLYVRGFASDVSIFGGYMANRGFSAIVLDGTEACIDRVNIRDIRVEGEYGRHVLYAKGCVRNITISGGYWLTTGGEVIRYEVPPKGGTWAENWRIIGLSLNIYDWAFKNPSKPEFYLQHYPLTDEGYVFARFDDLRHSVLELLWGVVARFEKGEKGQPRTLYPQNKRLIVIEKMSQGNIIVVRSRKHVLIKGEAKATRIESLEGEEKIQFAD